MVGVDRVGDGFNFFEHGVEVTRHSDAANRLNPDAVTTEKAACAKGKLPHRIGTRVKSLETEDFRYVPPRSPLQWRFRLQWTCDRGNPQCFWSAEALKVLGTPKCFAVEPLCVRRNPADAILVSTSETFAIKGFYGKPALT